MDDSDSGGLISPEEDLSGVESSGSSGHGRMEKTISRLKLKLRGFQEVQAKKKNKKKTRVVWVRVEKTLTRNDATQ